MRQVLVVIPLILAAAPPALAQPQARLPMVAADVRGAFVGLGQDPVTASDLGVSPDALPSSGIGGLAVVTIYPVRVSGFAVGVGGELLVARGRRVEATGVTGGLPPVERRLHGLSFVLSLNFGHRDGWSHLSAGIGPLVFESFTGAAAPSEKPSSRATLNVGGGARWFSTNHLAFGFDIRAYLTRPEASTALQAGRERTRILVASIGLGIK